MVLGYEIKHKGCGGGVRLFSCRKCKRRWTIWDGLWTTDYYWVKRPKTVRPVRAVKTVHQLSLRGKVLFWGMLLLVCVGLFYSGIWIQSILR